MISLLQGLLAGWQTQQELKAKRQMDPRFPESHAKVLREVKLEGSRLVPAPNGLPIGFYHSIRLGSAIVFLPVSESRLVYVEIRGQWFQLVEASDAPHS